MSHFIIKDIFAEMPGKYSEGREKENLDSSSSFVPSEAMLKEKEKTRERMRNTGSKPGSLKERRRSNGASTAASTAASKGKSYKTRSEREPKEMSQEEYFIKNKIKDTKDGSRNARTATMFRNYNRLGSDVFKKKRPDRIRNEADSDEEENWWLKSNYPKTDKYGVPIRNMKTKQWNCPVREGFKNKIKKKYGIFHTFSTPPPPVG